MASVQGRFNSPDPENAGADLANPQSWNAYAYVDNAPLTGVDPDGLGPILASSSVPSNALPFGMSCALNGVETSCGFVYSAIGAGAAVQCPANACNGTTSTGYFNFVSGAGRQHRVTCNISFPRFPRHCSGRSTKTLAGYSTFEETAGGLAEALCGIAEPCGMGGAILLGGAGAAKYFWDHGHFYSEYHVPGSLPAFPDATPAKAKTPFPGGRRKRWKTPAGKILEWDNGHGKVEVYGPGGKHLGEYDPQTGEQTKPADPGRKVER